MRQLAFWSLLLGVALVAGCAAPPSDVPTQQIPATRSQASARTHTELAAQYYERAQYGVAMDELDKALRARPDYATAYNVRALVHVALAEYSEADADFKHSLRLSADDPDTHNNYGWFLCQRGREREALQHFKTALKDPLYATPALAYMNAGVCSKKTGDVENAEIFLRKALALQPDLPGALLGLAEVDFTKGDFSAAQANFNRYAHTNGTTLTAQNLWLALRIERNLGNRNAEQSYALQLRKRFPDAPETQLMLSGK